MNQDFTRTRMRTGNGGHGGRGGDVGSYNRYATTNTSHKGDDYNGSMDCGDQYNGLIEKSIVGGRNNDNIVNNAPDANDMQSMENQLVAQLLEISKQLEAKRAKQRIDKLQAEMAAKLAELDDDE